jgi:hypothetical protein
MVSTDPGNDGNGDNSGSVRTFKKYQQQNIPNSMILTKNLKTNQVIILAYHGKLDTLLCST